VSRYGLSCVGWLCTVYEEIVKLRGMKSLAIKKREDAQIDYKPYFEILNELRRNHIEAVGDLRRAHTLYPVT